jgi:5-methylcytosine-specific restriction endonuclease McrA
MAKRHKEWARRKRRELIAELGGKCVWCGETEYEKLTFDHKFGKDWSARGKSTDQRMARYVKEAKEDKLQILCHICNSKKGVPPLSPDEEERESIAVQDWIDPEFVQPNSPDDPF